MPQHDPSLSSVRSASASHRGQQQDSGTLEEVPIRQPSSAMCQEQQAAGGATSTPGAELCGGLANLQENQLTRQACTLRALLPLTWICSHNSLN